MSTCTQQTMTNHHATGLWSGLGDAIQAWRERYRMRRELAEWSERDLHDVGMSWSDIVREAEKPFWRA